MPKLLSSAASAFNRYGSIPAVLGRTATMSASTGHYDGKSTTAAVVSQPAWLHSASIRTRSVWCWTTSARPRAPSPALLRQILVQRWEARGAGAVVGAFVGFI